MSRAQSINYLAFDLGYEVETRGPSGISRLDLWVTRDDGKSWTNITPKKLPDFVKFTTIEDSPHRAGTAYLTGHRNLLDDPAPYVFRTRDYGKSWTRIATPQGTMRGHYLCMTEDAVPFEAQVPEFMLAVPSALH